MKTLPIILILALISVPAAVQADSLTELEYQALQLDAGLLAARFEREADSVLIDVADALDDPRLKWSAANLPVDTFDFNQEPMTQAVIGISQAFPAGISRELRSDKARLAESLSASRQVLREKELLRALRTAWLDLWFARQQADLLQDKAELLGLITQAREGGYGSGESSQMQVAQVIMDRASVEEALLAAKGAQRSALARLQRWVDLPVVLQPETRLPPQLSEPPKGDPDIHPSLQLAQARSQISDVDTEMAKQRYRSSWSLESSYGYREDRSDFFSLGVSFSLPGFNAEKNDATLAAKRSQQKAARALMHDQRRQLQAMQAEWSADIDTLQQRIDQYRDRILPQTRRLERLAENDYAAGRADFTASLMARRQWIDQQLMLLSLQQQRASRIIQLRWLLEESRT